MPEHPGGFLMMSGSFGRDIGAETRPGPSILGVLKHPTKSSKESFFISTPERGPRQAGRKGGGPAHRGSAFS